MNERDRMQALHMALEGALEQLGRAHAEAAATPALAQLGEIEGLLGGLTVLRNDIRAQLMKLLAKPSLNILK